MKVSLMLKLFITFIITSYFFVSYAGKPELYTAESGETWTTGGSGDHGGLTPSGNTHQGVTSPPVGGAPDVTGAGSGGDSGATLTSGPTAEANGGSSFTPDPKLVGSPGSENAQGGGIGADSDNHTGVDNPSGRDNQGIGPDKDPAAGSDPNLPANNKADGGGPGDSGSPGGENTASEELENNAPGSDGNGEDSYTSSNDDQTNGDQEKKNDEHEQQINKRSIGFNFIPYPIVMADADMYTHIINLNRSPTADFIYENKQVTPVETNAGFKVVQMRRGSLTLGIGTSGGLTGVLSEAASGVLPRINFSIAATAGGIYMAERFFKTNDEAEKYRYDFYTRVPTDKKEVLSRMNIGDALTYRVSGSIAIGAGISAAYGTVGTGVGASVTGTWTKQIRRIRGRTPDEVRVQVAYVSGQIESADVNGRALVGTAAKKWYNTLDETIAYEFNLNTKKGEALFQEMLKGNILTVKYFYMKKLASAENLNRILKGWYWDVKKDVEEREVEFLHEQMIKVPTVKAVETTLFADYVFMDEKGSLRPFQELTLEQVKMLPEVTSVSASTLKKLIKLKEDELKLSTNKTARDAYIKNNYMVSHFPYLRLYFDKNKLMAKKVYKKELVSKRLTYYRKEKLVIESKADTRKIRALSLGLKWKRKVADLKNQKKAFQIALDRERVAVINTMKDTFDAFMISVGKRQAYGTSKTVSGGIPVLFSFNYNRGNEETAVETGKVIEEGVILKNYIGAYKAENRTTGLLSNHHTRSTAFYGGISDITLLKPATPAEIKSGNGPRKSIKIFAALKYAYDRDNANKDKWLKELKNLSERIGYRKYVTSRPRPYENKATYLQLTADWILSQEAILSLMAYQEKDKGLDGFKNTAIQLVKEWFKKNAFDEDNLKELSDKEISDFILGPRFKKFFGMRTAMEAAQILKSKGADGARNFLTKSFYNDSDEICMASKVGTKAFRNDCEVKYLEEVVKDLQRISQGLAMMNANNPFDPASKKLGYEGFGKLAHNFSKGMAKFGSGVVNNQFIVNTLQMFIDRTQKQYPSVDQYLVMQWQGSVKVKKGVKTIVDRNPDFPRGSFILIPSKNVIFRGNQICGSRGELQDGSADCMPSALDPI